MKPFGPPSDIQHHVLKVSVLILYLMKKDAKPVITIYETDAQRARNERQDIQISHTLRGKIKTKEGR